MRHSTQLGRALSKSLWSLQHARISLPNLARGSTGISWSHQLWTETPFSALHPRTFHRSSSSLLLGSTMHKSSPTHHWQKLHIKYSFLSLFLSPESLIHLHIIPFSFHCYSFSLINRWLSVSDLWFTQFSPPYGSGEGILVFLVLQFSQECNFLGERKKKQEKKRNKIFPFHIKIHSPTSKFSYS